MSEEQEASGQVDTSDKHEWQVQCWICGSTEPPIEFGHWQHDNHTPEEITAAFEPIESVVDRTVALNAQMAMAARDAGLVAVEALRRVVDLHMPNRFFPHYCRTCRTKPPCSTLRAIHDTIHESDAEPAPANSTDPPNDGGNGTHETA